MSPPEPSQVSTNGGPAVRYRTIRLLLKSIHLVHSQFMAPHLAALRQRLWPQRVYTEPFEIARLR